MAVFWLAYAICHALSTALSHRATFIVLADIRFRLTEKLALRFLWDLSLRNRLDPIKILSLSVWMKLKQPSSYYSRIHGVLIWSFNCFNLYDKIGLAFDPFISFNLANRHFILCQYVACKSKGDFENTVVKTKALNDTAVEYINGIEVIKVFGKEKFSYQKFVTAAKEGADCFIDWMRKCQFDMAAVIVIMPSILAILLPVGAFILFTVAVYPKDNFILLMILSMGLLTPLITLGTYMDDIRKVGTILVKLRKFWNILIYNGHKNWSNLYKETIFF